MLIIVGILWLALSIYAIYVDQYRWEGLFKVFIGATILAFLFNGWTLYNPNAVSGYAVTIELNDTWILALLVSFAEGACITGPIAAIHALQDWLYYDRNININPFRKTGEYTKEARKRLLEKEANNRKQKKQRNCATSNAKNLCRTADILKVHQVSFEESKKGHSYVIGTFTITNQGKMPVTDVSISKNLDQGKPGLICRIDISLGDRILNPGETATASGEGFQYWDNSSKPRSEYTYRYVSDNSNEPTYKVNTVSREAYVVDPTS